MSESEIYRVGNHQPQNLYRGEKYIGVMFDPADAAMVVAHLNANVMQVPVEQVAPRVFRDGEGDLWFRREIDGQYFLDGDLMFVRSLSSVKAVWGTWGDDDAS